MFARRLCVFALRLACLPLVVSLIVSPQLTAQPLGGLEAPEFPVPAHVSDRAQQILRKPINTARAQQFPKTEEEWRIARETIAASTLPALQAQLATAPINIEKTTLGGVTVRILTPDKQPPGRRGKVLMNLHGGAYVYFGGEASVFEALSMAMAGYRVVAVDYRMPPQDPFPAALNDAVAVYRALLKMYAPADISLFGASAGGGLVAATIVSARDAGLPLPAAAILNTPWSDLSKTGDSYYTLDGVDPILPRYDGGLENAARLYAGEHDLKAPGLSPVYADFKPGFPPSLLISGTRDLLLSCTVRLHRAIRSAGHDADLHVFDAMWHGFGAESDMPESQAVQQEVLRFLQRHMPD